MRLIDEDLLSEKAKDYFISPDGALRLIKSQPTAFDLESVIAKLKENEQDMIRAIKENSPTGVYTATAMEFIGLIEEYTKEQIEILNSAVNAANGKIGG